MSVTARNDAGPCWPVLKDLSLIESSYMIKPVVLKITLDVV